ncbi:MAG TPA: SDR family oxidoreductase [Candidatus Thermoplasmatota archaeon]|nr:SDR family oxidoreductase [Candidatus Thermoplasmatota archaeon]
MQKPLVLVTGTSSGIGREAVAHLRKAGCLVIATARRVEDIAALQEPGYVECLALDVADDASRRTAIAEVLRRHGRIDALVNNAGYGAVLSVEDTSAATLRAMHETNVVGPHDLARLVLPTLRRQGSGRIVNVSSIAGHVSVPLLGAYCSTKFALRALTQALDNEVRRFGVRALLVEPGVIRTNFGTRSLAEARADKPVHDGPYAALYARWALRRRGSPHGAHPRVIARRIVHACLAQHPGLHSFAPLDAKLGNLAKRLLPDSWIDAGMRRYFR